VKGVVGGGAASSQATWFDVAARAGAAALRTRRLDTRRIGRRLVVMSIHRDYVLRLVEAFARVLARAVAGRRAGRLDEVQAELEAAAASMAGVELRLVELVGPAAVVAQLADPARLDFLARLCAERAEVEAARGDEAAAARWRAHATTLAAAVPPGKGLGGA
jgi:hypothetical protein